MHRIFDFNKDNTNGTCVDKFSVFLSSTKQNEIGNSINEGKADQENKNKDIDEMGLTLPKLINNNNNQNSIKLNDYNNKGDNKTKQRIILNNILLKVNRVKKNNFNNINQTKYCYTEENNNFNNKDIAVNTNNNDNSRKISPFIKRNGNNPIYIEEEENTNTIRSILFNPGNNKTNDERVQELFDKLKVKYAKEDVEENKKICNKENKYSSDNKVNNLHQIKSTIIRINSPLNYNQKKTIDQRPLHSPCRNKLIVNNIKISNINDSNINNKKFESFQAIQKEINSDVNVFHSYNKFINFNKTNNANKLSESNNIKSYNKEIKYFNSPQKKISPNMLKIYKFIVKEKDNKGDKSREKSNGKYKNRFKDYKSIKKTKEESPKNDEEKSEKELPFNNKIFEDEE